VASKKEWKRRAKLFEQQSHELFGQSVARAAELARIDEMLLSVEFAGPTIEAYVAQTQQFLQRLVEERGLSKKSSSARPTVVEMVPSTSAPRLRLSTSMEDDEPDGEYNFLESSDVNRLGTDATRG
jgi:hypothetical protein